MEVLIFGAIILTCSIFEDTLSILLKHSKREAAPKEGKIDDALENRFARMELERDAPEFLPS